MGEYTLPFIVKQAKSLITGIKVIAKLLNFWLKDQNSMVVL